MITTMSQVEQVDAFSVALFDPVDLMEVRLLPSGQQGYVPAGNLSDTVKVMPWLEKRNKSGESIYIGINLRTRRSGKARDVALARCLFVDFDGIDANEAMRRCDEANLPWPTVMVRSGHGVHFYWRLEEPLKNLTEWTRRQKALMSP